MSQKHTAAATRYAHKMPHANSMKSKAPARKPEIAIDAINSKMHSSVAHRLVAQFAAASTVKDDHFVLVGKDSKTDSKTDSKAVVQAVPRSLGDRAYNRMAIGLAPIKTHLVYSNGAVLTAAATSMATVVTCDLANAQNLASWTNLFDEMRIVQMTAKIIIGLVGAGTYLPVIWTAAFDPVDPAAVSSHAQNMVTTKHIGPLLSHFTVWSGTSVNGANACNPPSNKKGHFELKSGLLNKSGLPTDVAGVLSVAPIQGNWVSTTTASAIGGYIKFYGDAPPVNVQWNVQNCFIDFEVEFKIRG